MTVKGGWLAEGAAEQWTYQPIYLPNLDDLTLVLNIDISSADLASNDVHVLSLASNLLSQLNPSSLVLQPDEGCTRFWNTFHLCRSEWTRATSGWTRLSSFSFVDSMWLILIEKGFDPAPLTSSEVPGCVSAMSFSWTFTDRLEGYARVSRAWKNHTPLHLVTLLLSNAGWLSIQTPGIQLSFECAEKDQWLLDLHLEKLPEEWKRLICCRGEV